MFLRKRRIVVLLIGDILLFCLTLVLTIAIGFYVLNNNDALSDHLIPFSFLIPVWILVFYVAGLYDKETLFFRKRLPTILLNAQLFNIITGLSFFYFAPIFKITPKTNLAIYFVISFLLILLWRFYGVRLGRSGKKQHALFIGSGKDFEELCEEIGHNDYYNIEIAQAVDIGKHGEWQSVSLTGLADDIPTKGISLVVIDMHNPAIETIMPKLYNFLFSHVRFLDMHKVYEEVFERIPLSLVHYKWFLEHVSLSSHAVYDFFKRCMDIIIGSILGIFSLIIYFFVYVAITLDDGGQVFTFQRRVGKNNQIIRLLKFRTMDFDDQGKWETGAVNNVTRVGQFLRKTRIDELPQLWNVLQGSISLIGPRPEFPEPVDHYNKKIPYYNIRYLIKPGLSGWAQILHEKHPHHGTDIEETAVKLSYDLYYIKNRSIMLDIEIALKTIKTLFSRSGI
ncbi:MAG: exopolysaccharide biosynthesis polyprenyl glycosylphosphotransferase [bacterium]|nr:exopolysaccharide biosynthesis polyprenyl glycosylphosphotransferase [bacterium]